MEKKENFKYTVVRKNKKRKSLTKNKRLRSRKTSQKIPSPLSLPPFLLTFVSDRDASHG